MYHHNWVNARTSLIIIIIISHFMSNCLSQIYCKSLLTIFNDFYDITRTVRNVTILPHFTRICCKTPWPVWYCTEGVPTKVLSSAKQREININQMNIFTFVFTMYDLGVLTALEFEGTTIVIY